MFLGSRREKRAIRKFGREVQVQKATDEMGTLFKEWQKEKEKKKRPRKVKGNRRKGNVSKTERPSTELMTLYVQLQN